MDDPLLSISLPPPLLNQIGWLLSKKKWVKRGKRGDDTCLVRTNITGGKPIVIAGASLGFARLLACCV